MRLNAHKASEFPFHNAYKCWIDEKHRQHVIPQPEKQRIDCNNEAEEEE